MNIGRNIQILIYGLLVFGCGQIAIAQTTGANTTTDILSRDPELGLDTYTLTGPTDLKGPNGIQELQEKVYFDVLPSKPRVGDTVEISTEMYGTPLKDATFNWYVNGVRFDGGIGKGTVSFYLDKKSTVRVIIITGQGNAVEYNWSFNPQNTVIIWESNTYTPPFYKGKSLYTPESTLVLSAINLDAKNPLTNTYAEYLWEVDGTVIGEESGVGKSTYIYKGDLLMQEPLFQVSRNGVAAYRNGARDTSLESQIESGASLQVQTYPTNISSFENTPLLGILFNKQISSSFWLNTTEASIVSYPVYYSLSSSLNGQYSWSINDELVKRNSNSIAFKRTRENEESRLSITIENPRAILQSQDISYIIDTSTPRTN